MNLDQSIDLARAALMEYGRPDLADLIYRDGGRARAPRTINTEDERAYYKAAEIVQRSKGKEMVCFDCWRWHSHEVGAAWPECEHR